jgi:hypothetical protein
MGRNNPGLFGLRFLDHSFSRSGEIAALNSGETVDAVARNFLEERIDFLAHQLLDTHLLVAFGLGALLAEETLEK